MKVLTTLTGWTALTLLALAPAADAELIYGVTDPTFVTPSLVSFDSATPGTLTTIAPLTGVVTGQTVRALDFRPSTGQLYALSSTDAGGSAQLYTVNLGTGALTTVGSGFTIAENTSTRLSIDFNPVVDLLRVVTGSTQNLRVDPGTGLLVGQDTNINPDDLISDVAYSNNVVGATQTTLYAYNFSTDEVGTIGGVNGSPSPNTGTFNALGASGVVAFNAATGFDISGVTGVGYVSLDDADSDDENSEFYTVDLTTGSLTLAGQISAPILDFSVAPVPAPSSLAVMALPGLVGVSVMLRRRNRK
jgi:hypothetical protein